MPRTLPPAQLEQELLSRLATLNEQLSSRPSRQRRMRGRARARLAGVAGLIAVFAVGVSSALAVHDLGLFQLEGNVADNGTGDDWANIFGGTGSALKSVFVQDDGTDGIDDLSEINFIGGGSKDDLDVNKW